MRFVELWVRFAAPALDPNLVSVPLLVGWLRTKGRIAEAELIETLRPRCFGLGYLSRILTSADVDLDESAILVTCGKLSLQQIRKYSYGSVFYEHVRSALVHEYHLGEDATTWPMTSSCAGVSYTNVVDVENREGQHRQIHFTIEWLADLVRSIAASAEDDFRNAPLETPVDWWVVPSAVQMGQPNKSRQPTSGARR
jgi:hypothetical protein